MSDRQRTVLVVAYALLRAFSISLFVWRQRVLGQHLDGGTSIVADSLCLSAVAAAYLVGTRYQTLVDQTEVDH